MLAGRLVWIEAWWWRTGVEAMESIVASSGHIEMCLTDRERRCQALSVEDSTVIEVVDRN